MLYRELTQDKWETPLLIPIAFKHKRYGRVFSCPDHMISTVLDTVTDLPVVTIPVISCLTCKQSFPTIRYLDRHLCD